MFRTALRNVLAHKARLLMTVLAVMLGVAFVSGTLVFTDTLGSAYKKQSATSYDNVAVDISSTSAVSGDGGGPGGGRRRAGADQGQGLSRQTLDAVAKLPGVASATGRVASSSSRGAVTFCRKAIGSWNRSLGCEPSVPVRSGWVATTSASTSGSGRLTCAG